MIRVFTTSAGVPSIADMKPEHALKHTKLAINAQDIKIKKQKCN